MSMDLIVSEQGRVMIASTETFAGEISRVDFDTMNSQLTLNYRADHLPPQQLELPVNARLAPVLLKAPRVLLVAIRDNAVLHGFDVPLTCIEHA